MYFKSLHMFTILKLSDKCEYRKYVGSTSADLDDSVSTSSFRTLSEALEACDASKYSASLSSHRTLFEVLEVCA